MRPAIDAGARRLLRRIPHANAYSVTELVLLSLLAVQCARLFWTLVTPVGPVGDWQPASTYRPTIRASAELLGSFDPFFRTVGSAGPAVVTSLNIQLFGVREDRASGRSSAIIGTPDGQQKSYLVGEEIMPGVTLQAVAFDNVTIARNGASEQVFMDQSGSAPAAAEARRDADETVRSPSVPAVVPQANAIGESR